MITAVTVTGTNPTTAPSSAKKIIAVSDNTGDNQNLSITGLSSGAGTSETVALLAGKREAVSANAYTSLDAVSLSASPAGTITLREEGRAGVMAVYATANPSEGDTVTLGLIGYEQAYTFRFLARSTITILAASSITTGMYFDVTDKNGVVNRFWYNKNSGGGAPSDPGTLSAIAVSTGQTNAQVALNTYNAINAVAGSPFSADISGSPVVAITNATFGTLTITDGNTLFSISTVHAGHATAPYQVAIASTLAATLQNLQYAINDTGGIEGSNYSASTDANPFFSAAASGARVTFTDRIACSRSLAWNNSASAATMFIVDPVGGVNGAQLAVLSALATTGFNSLSFNNEDLSLYTLPALLTPTSDKIFLGSNGGMTVEALLAAGSDIGWKVQTSTDGGITWRDADDTPADLTAATLARFTINDFTDMARIVIMSNPNTVARALHMKVVS